MSQNSPWWDRDRHADRRPALLMRNALKRAIRDWFADQGFVEIEAGCLQVSPGNETHLHAFSTTLVGPDLGENRLYLHTSPEFACKKLMAAGEGKIFTFAPVFRNRERGRLHHPEFCMLEWYRAGETTGRGNTYAQIQHDCDVLLDLARTVSGNAVWWNGERVCDVSLASAHATVWGLFDDAFGIDLAATLRETGPDREALVQSARRGGITAGDDDTWGDVFSKLMVELEKVYGGLDDFKSDEAGHERALLLDAYPACMSPLAGHALIGDGPDATGDIDADAQPDPRFAQRFELFAAGVELANGFGELNDADLLRQRLDVEMAEKERLYGERYPIDEDFIAAVGKMPSVSGCALGFDRLVMLSAGATSIDQVIWTPMESDR